MQMLQQQDLEKQEKSKYLLETTKGNEQDISKCY